VIEARVRRGDGDDVGCYLALIHDREQAERVRLD
jgi:hypothetical protein